MGEAATRMTLGPERTYHGCTTFGCEHGFNGTKENMPKDWTHCPWCGGDLTEITERKMVDAER